VDPNAGVPDQHTTPVRAFCHADEKGKRAVSSKAAQSPRRQPAAGSAAPTLFTRRASGLVREVSAWNTLAFNVMDGNIGVGLVWVLFLGAGLYPGANLYLAIGIAYLGILPLNVLYTRLSSIYARSGGDYTYMTRLLHPSLGFAVNLAAMVYFTMFVGVGGLYTVEYGLTPLLRVWAADSGNATLSQVSTWLGGTTGTLLVSLLILAAFAALMIVGGNRRFFRVQSLTFALGMVALAAIVVVGLTTSRTGALAHIDATLRSVGGGPLTPLASGRPVPFSWAATLHAAIWPWIIYLGCYFSVFIGGEVRQPRRTQTIGILGSTTWALLWMLLVTWAMFRLFGAALFANLIAAPAKLGLGATPTFAELTALSLRSSVLAVLLLAAFTAWGFAWVGPTAMCASRCVFAWSLDGLAPAWLRGVHARWHTPHHSLYVIFGLSAFWTVLLVYGKLLLLSGMSIMVIEWLAVALCGILLPRLEAPLWEAAHGSRRLGLPTIAWWGLLTIPPVLVVGWLNLTDVNSGTSLKGQPDALLTWLGILGGGFVAYFVATALQRRRGFDVGHAFRSVPPE
jgi:APA family basic amino acid/polyamine antiporter